jgi:predicted transposase/invertase (TIGR01784 family)
MTSVSKIIDGGGDVMTTIAENWEARGIKKGRQEGIQEGREKTAWEIIKNSLKKGLSINTISEITGFSIEQINCMKEKMTQS